MVRAWYMDDSGKDQHLENQLNPPEFLDLETLNSVTGCQYFKVGDESGIDYALLDKVKTELNHTNEDEIIISREGLPDYDNKLVIFYKEHLHKVPEVRLVLEGSGYIDVRDYEDRWIRIEIVPGDLLLTPAGVYHRFSLDTKYYIRAKKIFVDQPLWTHYHRPSDDMDCRKAYLEWIKSKHEAQISESGAMDKF